MSRKRKLQVLNSTSLQLERISLTVGHTPRSRMFKPDVSCCIGKDDTKKLVSNEEWKQIHDRANLTHQDQTINLRVLSDGERAYIKRVD